MISEQLNKIKLQHSAHSRAVDRGNLDVGAAGLGYGAGLQLLARWLTVRLPAVRVGGQDVGSGSGDDGQAVSTATAALA